MKGKLNNGFQLDDTRMLPIGTEVEIIAGYCGTDDNYYVCELPDGTQRNIASRYINVTDYHPHIDWQQVRINAAIAAMNGVISNPAFCNTSTNRGLPIKIAVDMADALIEELKKK